MDLEHVKELFPTARINEKLSEGIPNVKFNVAGKIVRIPIASLNDREQCLLILLTRQNDSEIKYDSPWEKYLFDNGVKPNSADKLRFLYITVNKLDKEQKSEWQHLILTFFKNETVAFWLDDKHLVIIDEECTLTVDEFKGMLDAVDNDFDAKTKLLVGLVWRREDDLRSLVKEEMQIDKFSQNKQMVVTVPDLALRFYLHSSKKESVILQNCRQMFEQIDYAGSLIHALYLVGGNVSQASKAMFVHRNTLEYRIDKLKKEFALNLRNMNDLTFCYLAFV